MKRFERAVIFITTILVSLMAMIMLISAETGDITVKVNGKTIRFPDQSPVVQNERTLVPVRFVAEALGYRGIRLTTYLIIFTTTVAR